MKPICCGLESRWVENVPGKGYNYCAECKNEVCTPQVVNFSWAIPAENILVRESWIKSALSSDENIWLSPDGSVWKYSYATSDSIYADVVPMGKLEDSRAKEGKTYD